MKIVIAGNWYWPQYEKAFAAGLEALGHQVIPFNVSEFFNVFLGKQQCALPFPGPALFKINTSLIRLIKAEKAELFLAWRCTHLLPSTIKAVNSLDCITVSYNNDDPFGPKVHGNVPWHHHLLWFWYLMDLKYYKRNFFYRALNVVEAKFHGASHADVLKSYFLPWQDRPVTLSEEEKRQFDCDVVFVGHYEADERINHLRGLVQSGLKVKLFGGSYWTSKVLGDLYSYFSPILPAQGNEYTKALCGAKICLVFLSKLNRDTYTRRCFEIPACGRLMLAERTEDLLRMFSEDKEACFFSSTKELVTKARWLIDNPKLAEKIAQAGQRRVWVDGHDVKSRTAEFINAI